MEMQQIWLEGEGSMPNNAALKSERFVTIRDKPPFRFVTVYEGFAASVQAAMKMAPLVARLRAEFEVQTTLWAFDEFERFPELIEQATTEMVEADMIVISTQSPAGLPPRIKNWIERWALRKQGNPSALVALMGPGNPARPEPSLKSFLQRAAQSGGMDFFCAAIEPKADAPGDDDSALPSDPVWRKNSSPVIVEYGDEVAG
jgi:hypothetical protein